MTVTADATADPTIISKSEFARRRKVTPGRVSQWIAERKITGDALVGQGRDQRICEPVAVAQLRARLDAAQRLGNGIGTRLDLQQAPAAAPSAPPSAPAAPEGVAAPQDRIDEQLKQAKLEQVQRANRAAAEAELARAGRYVLAAEAAADRVKFAREILVTVEGGMQDIADRIAAKFGLPPRDVLHFVRTEFRAVRARIASSERARAAVLPEFIDHDPSPAEPVAPPLEPVA